MKKRLTALLLAFLLAAGLAACSREESSLADTLASKAPAAASETDAAPDVTPEPDPTLFNYDYGYLSFSLPYALRNAVTDGGTFLSFEDPEGLWSMKITPLDVRNCEMEAYNVRGAAEKIQESGSAFYKSVLIEDTELMGFPALHTEITLDPDHQDVFSSSYQEAHAIWVVDYGDTLVGPWGGLSIDISAPEDSADTDASDLVNDPDVQTVLGSLEAHASSEEKTGLSFPGVTVQIPARWEGFVSGSTICVMVKGATSGNLYFTTSVYADPAEAASYAGGEVRTVEYGGRTFTGAVRESGSPDSVIYTLELYTDFSENHAFLTKLTLPGAQSPEDLWAFAEDETFRALMEGLELDPGSFVEPEDALKDANGFECDSAGTMVTAYTGTATDIVVPSVIGSNALEGINARVFYKNTDLTSVTVSEGITYIASNAFYGCTNLKKVVLPDSLVYIDYHAFEDCTSLESVTFGSSLETIGNSAFEGDPLTEVKLPDTVKTIGQYAFAQSGNGKGAFSCPASGTFYAGKCLRDTKYTAVTIGPNADLSSENILESAQTAALTIGEGPAVLGEFFFYGPSYSDDDGWHYYDDPIAFTMPASVTSVGAHAFEGRMGIRSIDISHLTEVGESAFRAIGIEEITVPGSLKTVTEHAFSFCTNLKKIVIEEGVEVLEDNCFNSAGAGKETDIYNYLTDAEVEQYRDVVHVDEPEMCDFVQVYLPSTLKSVGYAFDGTSLEGLYLMWVTDVSQLEAISPLYLNFYVFECVYFPDVTIDAIGDELQTYFEENFEWFATYGGLVRKVGAGDRHYYWTDEELGIDAC